jgi:acetyl-CoA carboxylase biotin carboxylase subunit
VSRPFFDKILIANRGEIALRVARTCRELGIATVAVYSTADRDSPVVRYADEAIHIGPETAAHSYLYMPSVVEAALRCGADGAHPGYGFLSEDADFARACAENHITLIGPSADVMDKVADKARVRALMADAGLPILAGSDGALGSLGEAEEIADKIGYPVVLKASAGGGGRGIEVVPDRDALQPAFRRTTGYARQLFGNGDLYLEKYLPAARHVEVQILCDSLGTVLHLGERDCSLQRRNQKLIEEGPSVLSEDVRRQLHEYAVTGARSIGYTSAGTMEFLVTPDGQVTFMEINCRIQVEHPVTEMLTGVDLIREQIRVAAGQPLLLRQEDIRLDGCAIEFRINAEDPAAGFRPAPGRLEDFRTPGGIGVRVDAGYQQGDAIPPNYDSLIAKLVVCAATREEAIARGERALGEFIVAGPGVCTTVPLLRELLTNPAFLAGEHTTRTVDELMAGTEVTRWVR